MLRVGLTGGLGSGKSTVGRMLAGHGAYVLQADEIGRELMQPGQAVYGEILKRFGRGVLKGGGGRLDGMELGGVELDRGELARLAFGEGRVEELNAIVHPAVIARQAEMSEEIGRRDPGAVVVVESALIFETRHGGNEAGKGGWRGRFDRLVLVVAPDELKIERFARRAAAERSLSPVEAEELRAEARRRLGQQMRDEEKAPICDYVLRNEGSVADLQVEVDELWRVLAEEAEKRQSR